MLSRLIQRTLFASTAALLTLVAPTAASAQSTFTWNLNNNGTWDTTTANWLQGGVAATWTNGANTALFGNVITASRTVGVAAGGITAGQITFDNTGTFVYTLGTASNNITLNNGGSNPVINVNRGVVGTATFSGTGGQTITGSAISFTNNLSINNDGGFGTTDLTIAGNVDRASAGGGITFTGQGNTAISGIIGSNVTTGLTQNGTGTVNLSGATNSFTGGVTVNSGVLGILSNDAMLGNAANGVTINNGGTFRFNNTVTSARAFNISGTAGIDLGSAAVATLTGNSASTGLVGSGTLRLTVTNGTGSSILSVEGAQSGFTGNVQVGNTGMELIGSMIGQRVFSSTPSATLRLQNGGTLTGATGITAMNRSLVTIVQPATAVTGRLSATAPISLINSHFTYTTSTNSNNVIAENFGALNLTGLAAISGSAAAGPSTGTSITFASVSRTDNAVLWLRGPATGTGSIGGTPGTGPVNYLITGQAPLSGLGTASAQIIPWAANTTSTTGTDPQNLITYDANGFRPLTASEATVVTTPAGLTAAAGQNVNLQASVAMSGNVTINSLFNSTGTPGLTGTGTLTITQGAISNFNSFTINGPTIDFGAATGYFLLGFPVTVTGATSSLTGSNGVVVSAISTSASYRVTFTNTTANTFTGGLFVNGNAQVVFNNNNQLGNDGGGFNAGTVTLGGGQLLFVPTAASTVSLSDTGNNRSIVVNRANGTIGTGFAGANLTIPGLISGSGQVQFGGGVTSSATGIVELTNASANTYTGGTVVSTGILRISNSNQLGTGTVFMNGGTLQASSNLSFASAPVMTTSSTIDTQANSVSLNGGLRGSGGTLGTSTLTNVLTKAGTGTLTIAGPSTFAGAITLGANAGTLTINGNGRLPELGAVSVNLNDTLNIDNSAVNLSGRTGRTTNLTLTNGGAAGTSPIFNLTTNSGTDSFSFGSLTVTGGTAGNPNGSTFNVIDGNAGNHSITFTSLTSIAANNTLSIVGTANLGQSVAGGTHIFFQTTPTLTGGIISGLTFTGFGGTGTATYDPVFGVILYVTSSGTFIDNINNVGPGSITPTNTNFITTGNTTANLGARINSLSIAGHNVSLTPGVYAPQAGNQNTATDTLVLGGGSLSSTAAGSTISAASGSPILQFGATGTTAASVSVGAGFDLTIASGVTATTTGGLTFTGTGTFTINGTNNITGQYNMVSGTLNLNSASTPSGISGSAGTINLGAAMTLAGGNTTTYSGLVAGAGNIVGGAGFTGLQVLSGANSSYTGAITINSGTIAAGNANAFGPAVNPAITVNNGGSMGIQGGITMNAIPVTLNGAGATGRNGALDNISGTNTYNGPITLGSNATIGATAGSLTLGGGITGSGQPTFNPQTGSTITLNTVPLNVGTNALTKTGGGTLVLPNLPNTMGNQNINGGLVQASADSDLGANTNTMAMNGGGFRYGALFGLDPVRPITLLAGGGSIDTNTFSPTLAQGMTGAGAFTKLGTGALTLAGTSTYGGSTTIVGGVITLGVNSAMPNGTALTIGNVATSNTDTQLNLNGFNQTVSSLTITARGSGAVPAVTGIGVLTVNGPISYVDNTSAPGNAFPVNIAASVSALDLGGATRNITIAGQNNGTNPGDFTINTVIQNGGINYTGNISSTNSAATALTFTGVNTYSGPTIINRGTLNANTAGSLPATTDVTVGAASGNSAILALGANQTIASLAGTTAGTNSVNMAANNLTVSGAVSTTFNGVISGSGAFTKDGPSSLTLTGANTYTGPTNVNGGALIVNGSLANTAVAVAAGAKLGGSGTIAGSVTVSGELSPGNSPGVLSVAGAVNLLDNSTFTVELASFTGGTPPTAGVDYDQVAMTTTSSTFAIGNNVTLNGVRLGGFTAPFMSAWVIVNNANNTIFGQSGTFAGLPNLAVFGFDGQTFQIAYNVGTFTVLPSGIQVNSVGGSIVIAAVPEPATIALMALSGAGVVGGLAYRYRRNQQVKGRRFKKAK